MKVTAERLGLTVNILKRMHNLLSEYFNNGSGSLDDVQLFVDGLEECHRELKQHLTGTGELLNDREDISDEDTVILSE